MVHSRESILLGPFPNASLQKIPNSVCWPKIIELAVQPHTWIFNTALYWISASQKFGFLARAALLTVGSQKLRDPCPALQHSLFAPVANKWLNSKQKEVLLQAEVLIRRQCGHRLCLGFCLCSWMRVGPRVGRNDRTDADDDDLAIQRLLGLLDSSALKIFLNSSNKYGS